MDANYKILQPCRHLAIFALGLVLLSAAFVSAQTRGRASANSIVQVPHQIMLRIVRAEDERRWDNDLRELLSHPNPLVRQRAALAAGRIGNEGAVEELSRSLGSDNNPGVQAMSAFALGEIESATGAPALLEALKDHSPVRARAIEALGKIAGALPKEQEARQQELGAAILRELVFERKRRSAPDKLTVLLGITAVLRSKPANAGTALSEFLTSPNPWVRADAANALARLKLKDGNVRLRRILVSDPDPIVRANAARVLGATEDKASLEELLEKAANDVDSRVRVSAIRALASLKDASVTGRLIERGTTLMSAASSDNETSSTQGRPSAINELLEIATTLGRLRQGSADERTLSWLRQLRPITGPAPEVEIALARTSPSGYLAVFGSPPINKPLSIRAAQETILLDWRAASSLAQGLGDIATIPDSTKDNKRVRTDAADILRGMLDYRNSGININTLVAVHSEYAIPDVLRSFAAFKSNDLPEVLRKHLKESDVVIRATAAELLGELPLNSTNTEALADALKVALKDKDLNDAALAILDALAKQKNRNANLAIQMALDSPDHLIRRKAVTSLKETGAGDFSSRIGTVQTSNTTADYERALARLGKPTFATVTTSRGSFTIELLPTEAPLTVDNFIRLAQRNYFNGITIHRVVPNFVIQDGDPRGDGNGGPGYQIRCEINEVPYDRGAVGMALSGKDTGGSQWFVTHSPQPHLDGGYTVFGKVSDGMKVVDAIVRGDVIRSIAIREAGGRPSIRGRQGNLPQR